MLPVSNITEIMLCSSHCIVSVLRVCCNGKKLELNFTIPLYLFQYQNLLTTMNFQCVFVNCHYLFSQINLRIIWSYSRKGDFCWDLIKHILIQRKLTALEKQLYIFQFYFMCFKKIFIILFMKVPHISDILRHLIFVSTLF